MFIQSITPSASSKPVFARRPEADLDDAFAELMPAGAKRAFQSGQEIFGQGESADYVYRVLKGAVRSFRLLNDGRRQICEFHFAGDFLGLEAGVEYRATAEAMSDCVVLVVRRTSLAELAARDADLTARLWQLAARGHQRSQDHAFILARQGATERVAAFLVEFAERVDADGFIDLPMSRQDIADYLGLTIHTVSRTFSQLQGLGLISVESPRHVRLDRYADLADLCS